MRFFTTLACLAATLLLAQPFAFAKGPIGATPKIIIAKGAIYQPGTILVKLKKGVLPATLNKAMDALQAKSLTRLYPRHTAPNPKEVAMGYIDLSRIYTLKFTAPFTIEAALAEVLRASGIEYAEPRYYHQTTYLTNDSLRVQQTHLRRIKADSAFSIHQGDSNTVVGIVDSGVDWLHPDCVDNIAYNRADPIDGIDNDNDGFVDNYQGWDLGGPDFNTADTYAGDNDPAMTAANNSHGSHVAGLAGATTDNNKGVVGTGFKCRILPIKCAADNDNRGAGGQGFIVNGYEGIVYGADHNCKVINCSWGGGGFSQYAQDVVTYATINKGALVVAAAGNVSNDDFRAPAGLKGVLAVAATFSTNDDRASFTSYNAYVGVSAPGVNILSTFYKNGYGSISGTSMSSPIVAGAAALLRSLRPELTPAEVAATIRASSDDIYLRSANRTPVYLGKLGKGRLNMKAMLQYAGPGVALKNYRLSDGNDNNFTSGDTITMKASYLNSLAPTVALRVTLTESSPYLVVVPGTGVVDIGVLAKGDSFSLAQAPDVKFVVLPGLPFDATVSVRVAIVDGNYRDNAYLSFSLNNSYVNFAHNTISSTIASNGRIGYSGNQQANGTGIGLKGWGNMLYEMGQISARKVGTVVTRASSVRGPITANPPYDNFNPADVVAPADPFGIADHKYAGTYTNSILNLSYDHRTYVWNSAPDTGFYIHEYDVTNTGSAAMVGLYTGFYADPDVSFNGQSDITFWDSTTSMAVVKGADSSYSPLGGPYIGFRLLSAPATAAKAYRGITNDGVTGGIGVYDGFTDAELHLSLSSGVVNTQMPPIGGKKDVSLSVGYGPINLAAAEKKTLAYAILVGYNLEALRKAANAADTAYASIVTSSKPSVSTAGIWLAPNPATNTLHVQATAGTQLSVLDTKGQVFSPAILQAASGFNIQVSELPAGIYIVQGKNSQGTWTRRFVKN